MEYQRKFRDHRQKMNFRTVSKMVFSANREIRAVSSILDKGGIKKSARLPEVFSTAMKEQNQQT